MRWTFVIGLVLGVAVGGNVACLLELDEGIACGDGYVDRAAGEQCDPMFPESFEGRCEDTDRPDGTMAACNPVTCQLEVGVLECGVCGDGVIDLELGEECESDVPVAEQCPGGGFVSCVGCRLDTSTCHACGNGNTEPGEECDDLAGGLAKEDPCNGLSVPGRGEIKYSGGLRRCTSECTWDFSGCHMCGNGELDEFEILNPNTGARIRPPEVCDGAVFNIDKTEEKCAPLCGVELDGLHCNVECTNNCLDLSSPEDGVLGCCVGAGSPRSSVLPCCCEASSAGCGPAGGGGRDCPLPVESGS